MVDQWTKPLFASVYDAANRINFEVPVIPVRVPQGDGHWLVEAPNGDQLNSRVAFLNRLEAAQQHRPGEVRYEPFLSVSLRTMEFVDIHYAYQRTFGVSMGPILWRRIGTPIFSINELVERWICLQPVTPGTVPNDTLGGLTPGVVVLDSEQYIAPSTHIISMAAEIVQFAAVDHRQRRRSPLLGNGVFTHNEMVCAFISSNIGANPCDPGPGRQVPMWHWTHAQILRHWYSCRLML